MWTALGVGSASETVIAASSAVVCSRRDWTGWAVVADGVGAGTKLGYTCRHLRGEGACPKPAAWSHLSAVAHVFAG